MFPQFKLECSGETYTNDASVTLELVRPENNISFLTLTVDDYKSSKYVDVFDTLDTVELSLRYSPDAWTKVFSGLIARAMPHASREQGEILQVGAWGQGYALYDTHCDTSYGVESLNSGIDTPKEILDDIADNYVNKSFGGAATGYAIAKAKIENVHAGLSVTHLNSPYDNNFTIANRVCDITNAYAQGLGAPEVSIHWFVDPSANWYVKKIDADHSDGNWDRYYGGSQAAATLEVKEDLILYDFRKKIQEYANKVVLSSAFRKPAYDYWTEDSGGAALWGTDGNANVSDVNGAGPPQEYIVGSHSLKIDMVGAGALGEAWYPAGQNAGWDLTTIGSVNTIPTINLWAMRNDANANTLSLYTDATHYSTLYTDMSNYIPIVDEWAFLSFPIGDYHQVNDEASKKRWYPPIAGQPVDWTDVNWIQFSMVLDVATELYVDDLHFSGKIIREAYSSADIAAKGVEKQKVIRNDAALDDTMVAADDSGTAAQLAYAELLRRMQTPIVGVLPIPLLPDLLPGQTVHIHACEKADGSFRTDQDFRVKELRHVIKGRDGWTTLNLTSDVTNSHAFAAPTRYSLLKEYAGALGHAEARNLKGSGIDNQIPRLIVDY